MINNINIIYPFATTRQCCWNLIRRKKGKPTHQRRIYHHGSISVRDGLGWSIRADKATLQGFHRRLTAGPWPWEGRGGVLWILVSRQFFLHIFELDGGLTWFTWVAPFPNPCAKKCENQYQNYVAFNFESICCPPSKNLRSFLQNLQVGPSTQGGRVEEQVGDFF